MGLDLSKLSTENKQLALALVNAGRVDDAMQLISVSSGGGMDQRTGPRQYGTKEEMVMRGRELGMRDEDLFLPEESGFSKFLADLDYGLESKAFGAEQLLRHVVPGMDTENIDRQVQEREAGYQESGLADEVTGGRLVGDVLVGSAITAAGAGGLATAPLRTGMAIGATEEAIQPVADENYWTQKGKDLAFGATVGGVTEGVPASMIKGTEMAANAPGAAYRSTQKPSTKEGGGWLRGDQAEIDANVALGERTGIDFTPGEVTQSGATQQVEELARSGLFTRNLVEEADNARAGQYDDYIKRYRDSLGSDAPIDVVAPKVQAWGEERATELINARNNQAQADYGAVRNYGGAGRRVPERTGEHGCAW